MSRRDPHDSDSGRSASHLAETPSGTQQFSTKWVGGWVTALIVVLFTIFWCLGMYWLIPERTRDWQYGVFPYVPGQSFLSTREFRQQAPAKQVQYPSTVRSITDGT